MNALYDRDADRTKLKNKTIAVIGYGSQGRAHARNLHDSGVDVVVGLRDDSPSRKVAAADGIPFASVEEATKRADIVMILAPDEEQPAIFINSIAPNLRPGAYLVFAHGFGIHFGTIAPPKSVNVFMVAPKGPGTLVRTEYEAGRGVPCLIAIAQDPSGDSREVALAYASAIGGGRAGTGRGVLRPAPGGGRLTNAGPRRRPTNRAFRMRSARCPPDRERRPVRRSR